MKVLCNKYIRVFPIKISYSTTTFIFCMSNVTLFDDVIDNFVMTSKLVYQMFPSAKYRNTFK